ncbi:hypothetical protein Fcan01_17340 [Folsomia candida]|uniref:Uncharacterized protein n=1 Tax=Folsomia candida TaxID=158441 RepID=A0A226DTP6_FOLCA|nr:hypothetical protein Fcan01_17340 [Folsomia candida]
MVATPLMWKSLDNFATSYSYLYTCPLEWDRKSGKLVYNKFSRKLIPWAGAVFSALIVFIACSVLLSCRLFGVVKHVELSDLLLTAVFLCLATFGLLLEIVLLLFSECFAHSFNCCVVHVKKLGSNRIFQAGESHLRFDPLGITLNVIVAMFAIYPYFMYPFIVYFRLDPFTQIFYYLLPHNITTSPLISFIFMALRLSAIFPLLAGNRLFSCIAITTTLDAHLGLTILSILASSTNNVNMMGVGRRAIDKYLEGYYTGQIILEIGADFVYPGISIVMFLGFWFSVSLNFMTMKTYGIVPMPFYAFFPTGSLLTGVLISFMLPMLVDVYENSGEMYAKWKHLAGRCPDKKYLKRKLRATRVVRIYGGINGYNFYVCKKSTKLTYYGWILSYTISALLSVDTKSMRRTG